MPKRNLRSLRNPRNKERGIALLIVLMALFLVAAVGMGMIYMSNTETTINANYRDTQTAFFSMRGGLEEMRDRMRASAPNPIALPTAMPGTANSIIYITNPGISPIRGTRKRWIRKRTVPLTSMMSSATSRSSGRE